MAEKLFSCFYCPAQFKTFIGLEDHRAVHDTTDAESDISDISDKTDIYNCYYSSQESDNDKEGPINTNNDVKVPVVVANRMESSEEPLTDVDTVSDLVLDNDRDEDFMVEESGTESEEDVKSRKSKARSRTAVKVNKRQQVLTKVRSKYF